MIKALLNTVKSIQLGFTQDLVRAVGYNELVADQCPLCGDAMIRSIHSVLDLGVANLL